MIAKDSYELSIESRLRRLVEEDPLLKPYEKSLRRRIENVFLKERSLTEGKQNLVDFASGHEYFGLHLREDQWVLREWAPNATAVFLIAEQTCWRERHEFALRRIHQNGVWEIRFPKNTLSHGDLYRYRIHWPDGSGDRIPAWARRVVQDPDSLIFNAQVWKPASAYLWKYPRPAGNGGPPLIYEAHIGMAQEKEGIGTCREFVEHILPRIAASGYNTIQLMAIQEHPYYASFGYQVSSFFAPCSRYGDPDDLKSLIDAAHAQGLRVTMDIIHSHAVSNEVEGLSRFDGTLYQFFHEGPLGYHEAWNSRCFDYGKNQVLHFLLSNCRYWLDEFNFDGFRFDGITSMLYRHHGIGKAFCSYDDYFDDAVDEDALVYLALANKVVHDVRRDAMTIAEDVSGMPGLATALSNGGIGFDYRFAMGVPDYWIRLTKDIRDEDWHMGHLWFELTNRRRDEKTISYAESHDQAIVGDQTLIFRLISSDMYEHMHAADDHLGVARGMALHKMIRLITLATSGHGYLNFMGNEFGHPEWIDFPREGNNWSYRYAQRRWHLSDSSELKYHFLQRFDREMILLAKRHRWLQTQDMSLLVENSTDKILIFRRGDFLFAFNFHPERSFFDYRFQSRPGKYYMILDSDETAYGGHGRLMPNQEHFTMPSDHRDGKSHVLSLYLPSRVALVLRPEWALLGKRG